MARGKIVNNGKQLGNAQIRAVKILNEGFAENADNIDFYKAAIIEAVGNNDCQDVDHYNSLLRSELARRKI